MKVKEAGIQKMQSELEKLKKKLERAETENQILNDKLNALESSGSDRFYEMIIEGVQDGIWVSDKNDIIFYTNSGMEKIAGIPRNRIMGKNIFKDFPEETTKEFTQFYKEAKKTQKPTWYDGNILTPGGKMSVQNGWIIPLIKDGKYNGTICTIRDITDQREAEKQLKTEHDYLKVVFDSVNDAFFVDDADTGEIIDVNQRMCEMYGYTYEEVLKIPIGDLSEGNPPYSQVEALQWLKKAREEGPQTFEWLAKKKNGELFWIEISIRFVQISGKNRFIVSGRNIDERKQAEIKLKESENLFRAIVSTSQSGIIMVDTRGNITFANKRMQELTGYTGEELLKLSYPELVHPDEKEKGTDKMKQLIAGKIDHVAYERHYIRKDGSDFWGFLSGRRLSDEKGKIISLVGFITDNTEQRKAEEALKESESIKSIVLNSMSEMFCFYETDQLHIKWANKAAGVSVNKDTADLIGKHCHMVWHNNNKPCEHCPVLETFKSGEPCKAIQQTPDGRYFQIKSYPVFDEQKTLTGVVEYGFDITQEQITKKALEESEKKFKKYIDYSPTPIFVADESGRYTYVNQAAADMLKYTREELVQRNIHQIRYNSKNAQETQFDVLKTQGYLKNIEVTLKKKNGEAVEIYLDAVKMSDNELIAFCKDISEIKKYERDIIKAKEIAEENEEKFRTIFEMSLSLMCIADINTATFLVINPSFKRVLGYDEEELLSKPFLDFVHPDDVEKTIRIIEEELQKGTYVIHFENRYRKKNGDYCYLDWSSHPIKEKGLTYAIANDITEIKEAQFELEKNERMLKKQNDEYEALNEELKQTNEELFKAKSKAEESDQLKSAFLANMSHEIRTPMNGIIGFAEMINKNDLTEQKRKYYSEIINSSCQQLLSIVNDILDISKIETGQIDVSNEDVNINEILLEIFSFHQNQTRKSNLNLYVKKGLSDQQCVFHTDGTKIRQILNNLVSNAIKFTTIGSVEFGYQRKDNLLEFFVKDTGTGIPQSMHEKIFERFRQGESGLKRSHGGTGLGLAISKSYIELLGGKIWLNSKENEGTTFFFTIPVKQETGMDTMDKQDKKDKDIGKDNILIVEDEEVNFIFLQEILEEYPLNILYANDGKQAVDICRENKSINLVLMDIKLPVMDGYEATRIIKKIRPELPIIAQTAYAMKSDKEEAKRVGCDGYIAKPIDKKELIELIGAFVKLK